MPRHLILGAGPIGSTLSDLLVSRGEGVAVATRSGTALPGAEAVRLDAADPVQLAAAATGAGTIFVCTNPPYSRWAHEWPPIIEAVIFAARATGAGIVLMGNLYGYGRVAQPMTESLPLRPAEGKGRVRAALWRRLLEAHEHGEVRATEVRASDYFGPGAGRTAHLGSGFFGPLAASKTAWVVGDPDRRHSWAYLPDIAETLAAAAADEAAFGRPWLVPHSLTASRTAIAEMVNERTGAHGKVRAVPSWLLGTAGTVSPMLREVQSSSYQFRSEFIVDSSVSEQELGVRATGPDAALDATLAALGARATRTAAGLR